MQKRDLVTIRVAEQSDEPLIFATWLKGLRYANDWFEQIDQQIYYREYHKVIELILQRSRTLIACLKDDEDVILGYSVTEPKVLHWVFVKPAWRGIGLLHDLVASDVEFITHITKTGLKLKPGHVKFNPFI